MKPLAIILYTLAAALGAFGYWGTSTKAGQQKYDEMAGMIPFGAQVLAVFALFIVIVLTLIILFKRSRSWRQYPRGRI